MAHLGFTVVPQVRGRFSVHRVSADEAKFKLCRVKEVAKGVKGVPYMVTHDGRTIRYPDPQLGFMDTIKLDLETGKVTRCPRTAPDSLPASPVASALSRHGSRLALSQPWRPFGLR